MSGGNNRYRPGGETFRQKVAERAGIKIGVMTVASAPVGGGVYLSVPTPLVKRISPKPKPQSAGAGVKSKTEPAKENQPVSGNTPVKKRAQSQKNENFVKMIQAKSDLNTARRRLDAALEKFGLAISSETAKEVKPLSADRMRILSVMTDLHALKKEAGGDKNNPSSADRKAIMRQHAPIIAEISRALHEDFEDISAQLRDRLKNARRAIDTLPEEEDAFLLQRMKAHQMMLNSVNEYLRARK